MTTRLKTFLEYRKQPDSIHIEVLEEDLNDYQKRMVDRMPSMSHDAKRDHDAVFGKDNDRIVVPLRPDDAKITHLNVHHDLSPSERDIPNAILGHLASHGYHTEDYLGGKVAHHETPNRKIRINKALDMIGSQDEPAGTFKIGKAYKILSYKDAYAADPYRAAQGDKQLVITRHRHDVAGVSTGRTGWSSCMTLPDNEHGANAGENHRYIQHDLHHGSLAAYVTRKGDDTAENPVGRITIKQFSTGSHRIYRPEGRNYGNVSNIAKKMTHEWTEKNYPSNPGVYLKNSELYNDDGDSLKVEKVEHFSQHEREHVAKEFQHSLTNVNRDGLDAIERGEDKHGDIDHTAYPYHMDRMQTTTSKLFDSLPNKEILHHTIRLLVDHASDHDGDPDNANRIENEHPSELTSHDYMHDWALNRSTEGSMRHEIGKLTPDEALSYHKQIDNTINNTDNPDEHERLKAFHSSIIDHLMAHGTEAHKDSVLHDMMGYVGDDHKRYYETMMQDNHTVFDNTHPALFTKSPRVMHHMLDDDDRTDHFPTSNWKDSEVAEHVGKHADQKLANHMMYGENAHHFDTSYGIGSNGKPYPHGNAVHEDFIKGLNKNPNGENIQHGLTSQMVLTGGFNPDQETRLPLGNEQTMTHYRKDVRIPTTETSRGLAVTSKAYETPQIMHDLRADAHDSSDDVDKFALVAEHSKFQSVVDKLKNRHDTQIPAIQKAVRDNHHVLHEGFKPKSLGAFLSKAKQIK